jgi:hypothetical protein
VRLVLAVLGLVGLCGCDDGSDLRRIARLKAQAARMDPPSLWSIEALDQVRPTPPILICANARIVSGFASVVPAAGGRPCVLETSMIPTPTGVRYRCRLDGVRYAVSSGLKGDRAREFVISSSIYPLTDGGFERVRVLRFKRRGACPKGWRAGEATDRAGARRLAFTEDPSG